MERPSRNRHHRETGPIACLGCLLLFFATVAVCAVRCEGPCLFESLSPDGTIRMRVAQKGFSLQKQSDRPGVCRFYEEPSGRLVGVFEVEMIQDAEWLNWSRVKVEDGRVRSIEPAFLDPSPRALRAGTPKKTDPP